MLAGLAITTVFPNPASADATVEIRTDVPVVVSVMVYDLLGRLVASVVGGWLEAGSHLLGVDASDLPACLYALVATTGRLRAVSQLSVVR